ncbi:uncharacterized protein G2W53_003410 [Senna tora]|uniref:Uncharacterized protein n=1 Tax=Senna tora TaxID=362788 RepID=A0A835CJ86_9FABA|nr:uncharacterized protein G2W53_003410 [Senna tora]
MGRPPRLVIVAYKHNDLQQSRFKSDIICDPDKFLAICQHSTWASL